MKKNNQEPVKVVLSYKANEKDNLRTNIVTTVAKAETKLTKIDESTKVVRRYSFDDNGGGYLGL